MAAPGDSRAVSERDREIGKLIRAQRVGRGMSQTELADAIGVSFQQVQKYEKGSNRVGVSRLERIAGALTVPPGFFFVRANGPAAAAGDEPGALVEAAQLLQSSASHRMLTAFNKIRSRDVRGALVALAEAWAAHQAGK